MVILTAFYGPKAVRLYKLANLYNEDKIASNFINIDKIFQVSKPIPSSKNPHSFVRKDFKLPDTYFFEGEQMSLEQGLSHFKTDGLIVLHNGELLYENYWNGNTATSKHIAFSVTKSFVSALVGIAHHDGLIDSIEDPITKYLPDFNGTGYEGVRIKDILQMSSGVKWNEDYADPDSDINRFGRTIARGSSFRDFAKTLKREKRTWFFPSLCKHRYSNFEFFASRSNWHAS